MKLNLVLGGGHGTQALIEVANQKIYFGTWDDGGSSGFLRSIYPDCPPFGDLRSVLVSRLKRVSEVELSNLLSLRSSNINELITSHKQLAKLLKIPGIEGFEGFLEDYYELKLKHLITTGVNNIPEDNLGNLLFLYCYKVNGLAHLKKCIKEYIDSEFEFGFIYTEPVFLYGYYYDTIKSRLKILDSEEMIDRWNKPVIRFSVRDALANHPSVNPELLLDLYSAGAVFLAPGSPENYLPALQGELLKQINKHALPVVLLAQLVISSKDQTLESQIRSLSSQLNRVEFWFPSLHAVRTMLADTYTLLSYAVQGKFIDVFFIHEYRKVLEEFLSEWKTKASSNELYSLLYEVYMKKLNAPVLDDDVVLRPCLEVYSGSEGWKHDKKSVKEAYVGVFKQG